YDQGSSEGVGWMTIFSRMSNDAGLDNGFELRARPGYLTGTILELHVGSQIANGPQGGYGIHHVAITYDPADSIRFYMDGVADKKAHPPWPISGGDAVVIGGGAHPSGILDELSVYN